MVEQTTTIAHGVWHGWTHHHAATACEWQIRTDQRSHRIPRIRVEWEHFEATGTLPELKTLRDRVKRNESLQPDWHEAQWPWVQKLRSVPIPWPTNPIYGGPSHNSPEFEEWASAKAQANEQLARLNVTVGHQQIPITPTGLLLRGPWRGWTVDNATAWSNAFFTAGFAAGHSPSRIRSFATQREQFQATGQLPDLDTWPASAARFESHGRSPAAWLAEQQH